MKQRHYNYRIIRSFILNLYIFLFTQYIKIKKINCKTHFTMSGYIKHVVYINLLYLNLTLLINISRNLYKYINIYIQKYTHN